MSKAAPAKKTHLGYIPALDGVRALAVFLVIASHVGLPGFPGGGFGVDMFFVLSGFLITTLLLEEINDTGRINILHFYVRRLLRLYPALLLLLLLVGAFFHIVQHAFPNLTGTNFAKDGMLAALYLTDYAVAFGFENRNSLIGHTWSLAVEEHFYLVWPWALLGLRRAFRGRSFVAALFALYIVATAWRLSCLTFEPWTMVYFRFDTRFAGLVLGSLLAVLRLQGRRIPLANAGFILSGLGFLSCVYFIPTMEATTALTTVPELFTFFLIDRILNAKNWRGSAWLSGPALVFFGRISYGLYLFHFSVAALLSRTRAGAPGAVDMPMKNEHWAMHFEITLAGATALAWFSWKTVEKAGRVRAKQFRPRGSGKHLPPEKSA